MSSWRIIYGGLVIIAIIAYFMPWADNGQQALFGWQMILPLSFTYFIGLILGIVIFATNYKPVGLSIFAGILMIIGVVISGGLIGVGVAFSNGSAGGYQFGSGIELAALISLVYAILGPIAGNNFKKASTVIKIK